MNEKNIQRIVLVIVSMFVIICSSGCQSAAVPVRTGVGIQRNLDAAKLELAVARERIQQLGGNNERALEIVQRSEQRHRDFEAAMVELDKSGLDIFDRIEKRNRLLEQLVTELWRDNQELREQLESSD